MTLTCESYLWGGSQTMTRSYQMHCTCDDLPSSLSYLSNHLWLWKQKWLLGTGQNLSLEQKECCCTCENHLLAQDKTHSKQANFYLCHMKTIQKQMRKLYFFQTWSTWSEKGMHFMRFLCVSYAFLFFPKHYLATKLISFTRQK